jgi:hypothetical protein
MSWFSWNRGPRAKRDIVKTLKMSRLSVFWPPRLVPHPFYYQDCQHPGKMHCVGKLVPLLLLVAVTPYLHHQDSRAFVRSWRLAWELSECELWVTVHICWVYHKMPSKTAPLHPIMMMAANIRNDTGTLGQALFMVKNATFEHGTLWALRSIADDVCHPVGSIFSEYVCTI